MAFIVVYDANALVGNTLCDLLVRIAQTGLVQAKWTERILDEAFAAVLKSRPDIDHGKLSRVRELMIEAVPDSLIRGHEPLIEGLQLPSVSAGRVFRVDGAPDVGVDAPSGGETLVHVRPGR